MLFYFFYFLLSIPLFILIHIYKFFNKKIYNHFKKEASSFKNVLEKLSYIDRKNIDVLIFHAASAGEFEQLKPILKRINRSKYFIIQTFTSPTIFEKESNSILFDVCCYHPYDFFWKSYSFFSKIKPQAYVITRHDIWPSHLYILNKLKIKTFYINANMHMNSLWINVFLKPFSKYIFKNLNFCLVPSQKIKNEFIKIYNPNQIHIMGDTRFDQIIDRRNQNNEIELLKLICNQSFNIIFGSYDQYDESMIIESLSCHYPEGDKSLTKNNHKIILVPHEIHNNEINAMALKLKNNGFKPYLYSKLNQEESKKINLLFIDVVGILADIYKYTQLAYVGSGFNDGVHSVIEPGIHGNVVSFGPNIELLDEAKYMHKNKIGYMIKNSQNMIDFINLNRDYQVIERLSKEIQKYIYQHQGTSDKIIQFIESKL